VCQAYHDRISKLESGKIDLEHEVTVKDHEVRPNLWRGQPLTALVYTSCCPRWLICMYIYILLSQGCLIYNWSNPSTFF
jgi:hypothetical protein